MSLGESSRSSLKSHLRHVCLMVIRWTLRPLHRRVMIHALRSNASRSFTCPEIKRKKREHSPTWRKRKEPVGYLMCADLEGKLKFEISDAYM